MRLTVLFFTILFYTNTYSQNTDKIKQIDSLVFRINNSDFLVERDTVKIDLPELKFKSVSLLSMTSYKNKLLKFSNFLNATSVKNDTEQKTIGSNIFYYDHDKLIEVEEYMIENNDKKLEVKWYFSNDKFLYSTLQNKAAEVRAEQLLIMSKSMQEKFYQKK